VSELRIILPAISHDYVSSALRTLTRAIAERTGEELCGGLGGDDGYGIDYETDVFEMHRFWWGDCECGWRQKETAWLDGHDHADTCYQTELERRGAFDDHRSGPFDYETVAKEWGLPEVGCAIHCTCDRDPRYAAWMTAHPHPKTCPEVRPNFRYKPTGAEVEWYKWIGRSMEIEGDIPADFLATCLASLEGAA
jgi:hypothetical protein